jgi:Cu(I)/Ag(I) efflux system membrane protein CusA/SilA
MINAIIHFSVRRRGWILLAAAIWTLAGLVSMMQTPIDAVPDLSENQVIVFAEWSGHGPAEIEEQVTYPLSLLFQGLEGARVIRASSDVGSSTLYLIFDDNVSFRTARERTAERLAASSYELPPGVIPRLGAEGIPTGQIFWYTVEGKGYDLGELRALQQWTVAPQLSAVPGVAEVASVGGFEREIHVLVDEPALLASGLSLDDVSREIEGAQAAVGGHIVTKGNAEFVVEVAPSEAQTLSDPFELTRLEQLRIPSGKGSVLLRDIAEVRLGTAPRRGMLEKDGNEVVGGVVHLRYGHNPLEVTRAVREKLTNIAAGLPSGVRLFPCYDRTPLITGAIGTVTRTLLEAMLVACFCVVFILRHARTSLVIAVALPLSVLGAFLGMRVLHLTGLADVQTNIMSIAGIVISIGVLVDSSIVLCENVMHDLRLRYGDRPVTGNVDDLVIRSCQSVGRPVFYATLIMLVSFLPVFALGGIDGRMYSPLAWTKSLSLLSAAILAITLVPALAAILIRGKIRDESESSIVRGLVQVYRPVLSFLMEHPSPLLWVLTATMLLAAAALGQRWLLLTLLAPGAVVTALVLRTTRSRVFGATSLILLALTAESSMTPLRTELRMPLNEGMVMDMPITVPRASIAQSADDVKARDMVLCRFPEVRMVVGKAGRADTPFDPAPLDMIETMIEFRPRDFWPRRRLLRDDALQHARRVLESLAEQSLIRPPSEDEAGRESLLAEAVDDGLLRFDAVMREVAHLKIQSFLRSLGPVLAQHLVRRVAADHSSLALSESEVAAVQQGIPLDRVRELAVEPSEELVADLAAQVRRLLSTISESTTSTAAEANRSDAAELTPGILAVIASRWNRFLPELNADLQRRAPIAWTRIASEELILRSEVLDHDLARVLRQVMDARYAPPKPHHTAGEAQAPGEEHAMGLPSQLPLIDPHPAFDRIQKDQSQTLAGSLRLFSHDPDSLAGFGGEMDKALQMPGWTNVWTKPIQNRVDMLATGVNAEVGVRVMGRNLDDVIEASETIAAALRELPGAADVVADPIRGKGRIQVIPDATRAAALGVSLAEMNDVIETALSGRTVTHVSHGREQTPVRLKLGGDASDDELSLKRLLVPARPPGEEPHAVSLDTIAEIRVTEGPATIKSENGWLRNYVRLNVTGRDVLEFVDDARRVVAARVDLPDNVFVEWTGQYVHSVESRRRLMILMPIVLASIVLILFVTYRDWADAALMSLAVPGALAGGVICQWTLGEPLSIAVGMGYIACFGMAAATGIVMLVYLRDAVAKRGGLETITLDQLREAVLDGAVHRLRPKLLTEATTILGLAPILWSTGVGAEVIRPMAAPVLGGLLVADEVIDLLLPILFYHVRRRRWIRLHSVPSAANLDEPREVFVHSYSR